MLPGQWDEPDDVEAELATAMTALHIVTTELEKRLDQANGDARTILLLQAEIVRDPALKERVHRMVQGGKPAPWAIRDAFDASVPGLRERDDWYGAERVIDLRNLRDRAMTVALGRVPARAHPQEVPFVLVAVDLSLGDTILVDLRDVRAIVTERGAADSHTAVMAQAMGIPCVVGCAAAARLIDGMPVLVDGTDGVVIVEPDPQEGSPAEQRAGTTTSPARPALPGRPGMTGDGHPVNLLLDVAGATAVITPEVAAAEDVEGIGVLRTDFLFLGWDEGPSMRQQRAAYGTVFDGFTDRPVTVRTMPAAHHTTRRSELVTQLAAIGRAAGDHRARVGVAAPMITTPAEAAEFTAMARQHGIGDVGVMIDVPAAAIRAAEILAEVDFVVVDADELARHAFAAASAPREPAGLIDPWQPASLYLINLVVRAAARLGRPAGVCGAAAADPLLAPVLAGLGVNSLTMPAQAVPAVRSRLRAHSLLDWRRLANNVLSAPNPELARELVSVF